MDETYAIFLVVHNDLLQRDDCTSLLRPGLVHLAKSSLSQLSQDLIFCYLGASQERALWPHVL